MYLTVANQRNHQTADTIEYEGDGEDILSCRPEDGRGSINGLRGDTYTEVILLVRLRIHFGLRAVIHILPTQLK